MPTTRTSAQLDWQRLDREVCWHPYTQHAIDQDFLPVVSANGSWLELADGRKILDAISSWWACLHGHAHPNLVEAIASQAKTLDHVLFAGCTHEPAVGLAKDLVDLAAPLAESKRKLSRAFFSDNGSTAVEIALKAVYQSWVRKGQPQRTLFLSLKGSYHGDTFGAMSLAEPEPFFSEFKPFLFDVKRIAPTESALATTLAEHSDRIAGFVVEPLLQGAAGMQMHAPEFLRAARKLCDQHNIYLIADEVTTGFGRTGKAFAMEHAGVCPDLMALGKGLTGGTMPLSATLLTEEIFEAFLSSERSAAFFHGHTYCANPIGCAVARASIRTLKEENTPQRLSELGEQIRMGLKPLKEGALIPQSCIAEIRQLGGVVAVEFGAKDQGYLSDFGNHLRVACKNHRNVLLRPLGNVLYAMPPASTTNEEANIIARAICEIAIAAWKAAKNV